MEEKIGIVADEAIDLPEEIIKENDISIVPFKLDLQELEQFPGNIYEKMEASEKQGAIVFVKTSQPSINEFLKAFKKIKILPRSNLLYHIFQTFWSIQFSSSGAKILKR